MIYEDLKSLTKNSIVKKSTKKSTNSQLSGKILNFFSKNMNDVFEHKTGKYTQKNDISELPEKQSKPEKN